MLENDSDTAKVVTIKRTSALGDTITTRLTIFEGVVSESVEIVGPPELLDVGLGGICGGKDWYRRESRPTRQREIWHAPNKAKAWA